MKKKIIRTQPTFGEIVDTTVTGQNITFLVTRMLVPGIPLDYNRSPHDKTPTTKLQGRHVEMCWYIFFSSSIVAVVKLSLKS